MSEVLRSVRGTFPWTNGNPATIGKAARMPNIGWLALLALVCIAGMVSRPLAVALAIGFVLWEYGIPRGRRWLDARRRTVTRP